MRKREPLAADFAKTAKAPTTKHQLLASLCGTGEILAQFPKSGLGRRASKDNQQVLVSSPSNVKHKSRKSEESF